MNTPRNPSRRVLYIGGVIALAVVLASVGYLLWPSALEEEPGERAWQSWAAAYPDLGALTASSDLVLRGTVTGWEADAPDGDDNVHTDRVVTVSVDEVFRQSDRAPVPGASITILNGWWERDRGFEDPQLPWLTEGQSGYFFLRYDAEGDRYSAVGPESRVMVTDEGLVPSGDGGPIWSRTGDREALADQGALERRIAEVVGEVEAGLHEPVQFEVCEPSVPGDEDSEPVCETTW